MAGQELITPVVEAASLGNQIGGFSFPPGPVWKQAGLFRALPARGRARGGTVVENVRHGAQAIPTSERQARPLAKLPAEQQPAAWGDWSNHAYTLLKLKAPLFVHFGAFWCI